MKGKCCNAKLFYRSFGLDRRSVNEKERSVEISFSSEEPVVRWGVKEILLHGDDNVDMSRLETMGSVLMNHNPSIIVGPVRGAKIEEKRGKATIVFDDDEEGNRAFNKVKSGSLRGVSVGYAINRMREVEAGEEYEGIEGPADVATRWTPYEVSLTPIPADVTVGVGRMRSCEGIEIENESQPNNKENQNMEEKDVQRIVDAALEKERSELPDIVATAVRAAIEEDNKPKMRIAPEKAQALLGRAGIHAR